MSYDLDFRFRIALHPEALATVTTTISMLASAIDDCRKADVDPDGCPAVQLLKRHLGHITAGLGSQHKDPADDALRERCRARLLALKPRPAIVALARHGAQHGDARADFEREAIRHLCQLAHSLGISRNAYRMERDGPEYQRPEIRLMGRTVFIRLRADERALGVEMLYRRTDRESGRGYHADVAALADHQKLAKRIAVDLALSAATAPPN